MSQKKLSKKGNKEYREAKKRLEKSQKKYTTGYKEKGNGARRAPRSSRSADARRWKDWRESEGIIHPVEIKNIDDL